MSENIVPCIACRAASSWRESTRIESEDVRTAMVAFVCVTVLGEASFNGGRTIFCPEHELDFHRVKGQFAEAWRRMTAHGSAPS